MEISHASQIFTHEPQILILSYLSYLITNCIRNAADPTLCIFVHLHRHEKLSFVIIFICLFIIKGPIEVIEQEHSVTPNDAELIQVRIFYAHYLPITTYIIWY